MHLKHSLAIQDVWILLPLVFYDPDDNEGSNDDNDINCMQQDATVIMLVMSLIVSK